MCGIVGYVGHRQACPIIIKGLHRLEYRGYDSAGVALIGKDGQIGLYKCKGKVDDLERFLGGKATESTIGIALTSHGYTFRSSTDSEVLVNLIEYVQDTNECSLEEAVRMALRQVVGAYAIAVVKRGDTDRIIAARQSSPMAIGIGEGEYFISSDAASIIDYTQKFVYLNDGEVAVIEKGKPLQIKNLYGEPSRVDIQKLEMSISQLEKGWRCPSPSWKKAVSRTLCSRKSTSSRIRWWTASGAA